MKRIIQILLIIAFIVWLAEWFQFLGHSFSSRLFQRPNWQLLSSFLEMLAIAVPPLSGYWVVIRRLDQRVSTIRALLVNLIVSGLPVFTLWAYLGWVYSAKKAGEIYISADSAMGISITFSLCFLVFLAENLAVVFFLAVCAQIRKYRTRSQAK